MANPYGIYKEQLRDDLIAEINEILNKLPKGTYTGTATDLHNDILAISTGVQGVGATTSNSPTGTGVASWLFAGGGTYTNYGGLVIPANHIGFIARDGSGNFSYVSFELDLSLYMKIIKNSVALSDTDIDLVRILAVESSDFKSTMIRPLLNIDAIDVLNAKTYIPNQHNVFFIKKESVSSYVVLSSFREVDGNVSILKNDFTAEATHYLVIGVTNISSGMSVIETTNLFGKTEVTDAYAKRIKLDVNSTLNLNLKKTSIVDVSKYVANRTIEPLQGREIDHTAHFLSELSVINQGFEYIADHIVDCFMFQEDGETYIGKATLIDNNSFTITDKNCYYVRVLSPNNTNAVVLKELLINSPYGAVKPKFKEDKQLFLKNAYKQPVQGFGDSIISFPWVDSFEELTGIDPVFFSYGGCTSSLIKKQFIELASINGNQISIIWCGHNNMTETQTIVRDIRDMVRHRNDCNFLIISSPTGTYGNESNTNDFVAKSKELEQKLQAIYGNRFLNMREAMVSGGYDLGDVHITQSFTQPAVNSNVNIYIDNVPFMMYDNAYDNQSWLPALNLFKIGRNGLYDEYEVISSTIISGDTGYLTAKLLSNPRIASGDSVTNLSLSATPAGSSTPINYTSNLEVFKSIDKFLMDNFETTPSSSRVDTVHPNDYGGRCEGEIIAYRLSALNFI